MPETTLFISDRSERRIFLVAVDVAVVQADNFLERVPDQPLMNLCATLSTELPAEGAPLLTYAYPENAILDFNVAANAPEIRGDYFQGGFLRFVSEPEHPFLRFPYFESTVELRSGASGGPVFDASGQVVAINCRGWDFRGAEHEQDHLSYLVPISHILDLEVDPFMVPPHSWEAAQLPTRRLEALTIRALARYGHIVLHGPVE